MPLTARQERERRHYEARVERGLNKNEVPFEPVAGTTRRPGNSYWYLADLTRRFFRSPDQRLLDFGCGHGYYAMQFARIGYQVEGFDISPGNVDNARQLARRYGFEDRTRFSIGTAEALNHGDQTFDIVVGVDILHHVDVGPSLAECHRVLKPGGVAVFHEPVRVPLFDALRESSLGRWLVPNTPSLDRHITDDERKLTAHQVGLIREQSWQVDVVPFSLFARLDKFFKSRQDALERFDGWCFDALPVFRPFAGRVVIVARK